MPIKDQSVFVDKTNKLKSTSMISHINSILPHNMEEITRPTLYRGLKYWGKKPHNIWREIILRNTNKKDIVYDPFAGSALTFFESIKIGRKPVVADINPITLFLVDVYSKKFNLDKISKLAKNIIDKAKNTRLYKQNYITTCSHCGKETDVYNYRVEHKPFALSYKCSSCKKTLTDECSKQIDVTRLGLWIPDYNLDNLSSISPNFIKNIGGKNISNLWTARNLELLSFIFEEINNISATEKDALMFAFMQILHLTTKMCALRSVETNRPLSTSWGRPAYLGLRSFMEQNPIIQFERAVFGNSGAIACIKSRNAYLPKYTYSTNLKDLDKVDGIVLLQDSKEISSGFKPQLVLTDPPYGSIIQYGELSQVWNVWLERYSDRYRTSLDKEIIINKNNDYSHYVDNMTKVLTNCRLLLYPDGTMILTFNSNEVADWEALEKAIDESKLVMKEKLHQKNKRSSEANIYDKNGLGITDFYLSLGRVDATLEGTTL